MRRYLSLLCVLAMVFCFTGCDSILSSPEDNLKPPLAVGIFEGVQEALENAVGTDIILKYPLSEGSRSAFCAHDLDGDGVKEVLAFYSENKELATPHINLLKLNSSERWVSVQDIESAGSEITEIDFADLDGDGIDELFIGCSNYTTKTSMMGIYHMEEDSLIQRAMEQYTKYLICDIDNNGLNNLVIALCDQLNQSAKFSVYGFNNDKFTHIGSTSLDSSITTISNMSYGRLSSKAIAVFLDGNKSSDTLVTEVVYYNGKDFINYYMDKITLSNTATVRHSPLISCDINNDGYIDIPIGYPAKGTTDVLVSNINELVKWVTFDAKTNPEIFSAWYSVSDGYSLTFDNEWVNNITITYDDKLGMAMFNRFDDKTNATAGEFLRIRRIESSEWNNSPPDKYIKVAEKDNMVWIARLSNPHSPLYIDRDTLLQRFRLIESNASYVTAK